MKKLAVIGKGTAGVLSAAHFFRWTDFEIDWYFDSSIKPQAVGEGTTLTFPKDIYEYFNFNILDLESIQGTLKGGITKKNWGKYGHQFMHTFPPCNHGYHFNAVMLQEFIFNKLKNEKRINIIDAKIKHDNIDADYIIDCSGKPENYDNFHYSPYIPVNSAYVTQCYWNGAKFQHTLAIAKSHGWIFGIPLLNRCSIGYMYNSNISSLDEIKDDVKSIFDDYELIPSDHTNHLNFKNYYRKQNFTERVCYNGNASFFLEPLEATSITVMTTIARWFYDIIHNRISSDLINEQYLYFLSDIEGMIMMHYASGSVYDSKFWKFAKERGEKKFNEFKEFRKLKDLLSSEDSFNKMGELATWTRPSYLMNIQNLGVEL